MAQKVRAACLKTLLEKSLRKDGSGYSNSDCRSLIGDPTSDTPPTKTDSSLPTETPSKPALGGGLQRPLWTEQEEEEGRQLWARLWSGHGQTTWHNLSMLSKGMWIHRAKQYKKTIQNGDNGATSIDQELFWQARRPIPQK